MMRIPRFAGPFMSDMEAAPLDAPAVAASRRPSIPGSRRVLGAAAGSAVGIAALASASGLLPTLGPESMAAWAGAASLGAAAGALLAGRTRAASTGPPPAGSAAAAAAEVPAAWLHVVSGGTRGALEHTLVELVARFLARGERVLVVDGGRRLGLHAWFGADERLGLVECLEGPLPLLGLVQVGGHPGLYVLAHGRPATEERWSRLGHLFEEAWPHFGRVVLVLDPGAHEAVGDALRGRLLRGWWAGGPKELPRIALALSQRLGISFGQLELGDGSEVTLETLRERVGQLRAGLPEAVTEPAALPIPAPSAVAPALQREAEVLACNLQVRERLRFLIWTRRVRAESRREALAPA